MSHHHHHHHHQVCSTLMNNVSMVMLLVGILIVSNTSVTESRNDLTTVQWYDCDLLTLDPNGTYMAVVNDLLDDIISTTPDEPDYHFFTANTAHGETAYGYADCDPEIEQDECYDCLSACPGALYTLCDYDVGAEVAMTACYMRYADYRFV